MANNNGLSTAAASKLRELSEASTKSTEAYIGNSKDRAARLKALGAAKQLIRELETGDDAWFARLEGVVSAQVLRWLTHLNVHHHIPLEGTISIEDLAAAVNAEPAFLVRFMRGACASAIFEEVEPGLYAHTKESLVLLEEGYTPYFEIMVDEMVQKTLARYPEYYADRPLGEPSDPKHNPFGWANGMDGHMWFEVLAKDPAIYEKFASGMRGRYGAWPATGIYPFDTELGELSKQAAADGSVFIVDVGGNQGFTMKEIRETYPQLKGKIVVQDIPEIIESIPPGLLPADIEPQVHDFWGPQSVRGAKVYYLRRIMHDWPDSYCQKILGHIADAMAPDSKLLAVDMLMPERANRQETFSYWMDMTMMMFAGKERTEVEWRKLFDASGLELVHIWKAEIGDQAVVEGRKKRV